MRPFLRKFVDERGVLQQQRVSRPLEQESTRTVQSQGGWKFYGFPGFKWKSVIGVVVAIQLIVYVMSLWLIRPRGVLQPTSHVLWVFGASNRDAETCGVRDNFPHHLWELRRWFVPIFLHGNPMHIMLNLYFECSAGPRIEERDSSLAFALLFLGAGMMGNLLSAAVGGGVSVGGSTSCYGIIGMDMALWYQRWNDLAPEEREHAKQGIVSSVGMLLLWEIIMWKEIDHFGHLGGFIGGFCILLGRSNRRWVALFALIAIACVFRICIYPLRYDTMAGVKWDVFCGQLWRNYL